MFNIAHYLQKFKKAVPREGVLKERCVDAVRIHLGVTLPKRAFKIQKDTLWIEAPSVIRHAILQKGDILLEYINNNPYKFTIQSVR